MTQYSNKELARRDDRIRKILNTIVFPCVFGAPVLITERPQLEGVNSVLCAKEIDELLERDVLSLEVEECPTFKEHGDGKQIVKTWAIKNSLDFDEEIDLGIGVVDVVVYADDIGVFEIGTTKPSKIILLLKFIARMTFPFSIHFWPYGVNKAFVFKNWNDSLVQST